MPVRCSLGRYLPALMQLPRRAAADAALALGRPLDKINDTARVLIDWVAEIDQEE